MSKILVTGATGFIGSHIVVQLLNTGHEVVGSMRDLKRADRMREVYAEHVHDLSKLSFVSLQLLSDEGWKDAFQDVEYVIHTASPFPSRLPRREKDVIEPAVEGTKRILKFAAEEGVKRLVLTSSIAAIMYGHEEGKSQFTEEDWSNPNHRKDKSAYTKSKTLAEKAAWDFIEKDKSGLELSVINPGMVLGPVLESDYGTSAIVIKKLLDGAFPGNPKLGWSVVDVRDVAALHIMAMTHPKAKGERFMAANDFMWVKDIAKVLKEKVPNLARKVTEKNLPVWLMKVLANFDREVKSVSFELDKKRENVSKKGFQLLGWTPRSNSDAIVATAKTLSKYGGLKL
ncbi:SDR family oxidoreductase [Roseivirga sp.]|uniref:SDR family oxidoreductase n=1 Tax=Roseivirga sp. TaxID=1964215 RepID=UPI003B8D835B